MKNATAKRYAKALIEIGKEDRSYESYGKELRTVVALFKGSPEALKVLLNPMYKIEERKALMDSISASVGASATVAKFFSILVANRNIRAIEGISEAYSRFEDELAGRLRVVVESPVELGGPLLEEIKRKISSATGKEALVSFSKNPALLGGLVVRMENTILDGSLKTQLERMREKILEGAL